MSTFTKPNTIANGGDLNADPVDDNFDNIYNALNTGLVHLDGSQAMTGLLTLPALDPTSSNQAARKQYVDNRAGGLVVPRAQRTSEFLVSTASGAWYVVTGLVLQPATLLTGHYYEVVAHLPALRSGSPLNHMVYAAIWGAADGAAAVRVAQTAQQQSGSTTVGGGVQVIYTVGPITGTPSVVYDVRVRQDSGSPHSIASISAADQPAMIRLMDLGTGLF